MTPSYFDEYATYGTNPLQVFRLEFDIGEPWPPDQSSNFNAPRETIPSDLPTPETKLLMDVFLQSMFQLLRSINSASDTTVGPGRYPIL